MFMNPLLAQIKQGQRTNASISRHQIEYLLKNKNLLPYQNAERIRSQMTYSQSDTSYYFFMPDSLNGTFKVNRIRFKMDNYTLCTTGIRKRKIYFIDIEDEAHSIPNLCIISSHRKINGCFIRTGDTIKNTLFSCFPLENFRLRNGHVVLPSLKEHSWIIFNDIFIENFPYRFRNYVFIR